MSARGLRKLKRDIPTIIGNLHATARIGDFHITLASGQRYVSVGVREFHASRSCLQLAVELGERKVRLPRTISHTLVYVTHFDGPKKIPFDRGLPFDIGDLDLASPAGDIHVACRPNNVNVAMRGIHRNIAAGIAHIDIPVAHKYGNTALRAGNMNIAPIRARRDARLLRDMYFERHLDAISARVFIRTNLEVAISTVDKVHVDASAGGLSFGLIAGVRRFLHDGPNFSRISGNHGDVAVERCDRNVRRRGDGPGRNLFGERIGRTPQKSDVAEILQVSMRSDPVCASHNSKENQPAHNKEHLAASHVARGRAPSALRRPPLVEFYSAPENQEQRPPAGKRSPQFELRVIGAHEQKHTHQDQYCSAEYRAIPRSAVAHRISRSFIRFHGQPAYAWRLSGRRRRDLRTLRTRVSFRGCGLLQQLDHSDRQQNHGPQMVERSDVHLLEKEQNSDRDEDYGSHQPAPGTPLARAFRSIRHLSLPPMNSPESVSKASTRPYRSAGRASRSRKSDQLAEREDCRAETGLLIRSRQLGQSGRVLAEVLPNWSPAVSRSDRVPQGTPRSACSK